VEILPMALIYKLLVENMGWYFTFAKYKSKQWAKTGLSKQ
jgi:hypothetical protein